MKSNEQLLNLLPPTIGMMDFGRVISLSYHLMQCVDVPGDVVEFGCHAGTTAALMSAITEKRIWVYDSFEGLPAKTVNDVANEKVFFQGCMKVDRNIVDYVFCKSGEPLPVIVSGWFNDIRPDQLPDKIAFAHVDGDFYSSIMDALTKIGPRLSPGAIVVVDDYGSPDTAGAKNAVDQFFGQGQVTVTRGQKGIRNIQCFWKKP